MPEPADRTVDKRSTSAPRFAGLLPERLLRFRRPLWWQEILLIAFSYWIYGQIRNAIPNKAAIAEKHARGVEHLQDALHLNWELSINHFVAAHEAIAQVMNYYYATLHFIVTISVLVWLFVTPPALYRGIRTVLFATSLVALAGFYLFPLAPPRLMPEYGYVDTLLTFHTWGSLADPNIAEHSNQFAAMPSLHIAWSLWCGIAILLCARRTWVRLLGCRLPDGHPLRHRRHRQPLHHRRRRRGPRAVRRLRHAVPDVRARRLQRTRRHPGRGRPGVASASAPPIRLRPGRRRPFDDPAGPPGGTPVVVDELTGIEAGRVAQRATDAHQRTPRSRELVARLVASPASIALRARLASRHGVGQQSRRRPGPADRRRGRPRAPSRVRVRPQPRHGVPVAQLEQLDGPLDVGQPAPTELECVLASAPRGIRSLSIRAFSRRISSRSAWRDAVRRVSHRVDHLDESPSEVGVAGEEPGTQQRLRLPRRGPPRVVAA